MDSDQASCCLWMFPRKLKLPVSQQCGHWFRALLPFPLTKKEHWQLGADVKADLIRKVIKKTNMIIFKSKYVWSYPRLS